MKFLIWMGSRTYLTNGQVFGWFLLGGLAGSVIGIIVGGSVL